MDDRTLESEAMWQLKEYLAAGDSSRYVEALFIDNSVTFGVMFEGPDTLVLDMNAIGWEDAYRHRFRRPQE